MKNSFIQIAIISILVILCQGVFGLAWWWVVVAAFSGGLLIQNKGTYAFLSGLMAVWLVWFSWAMIKDISTASLLSKQVGQLLPTHPSPVLLACVSGLVAAIPSGFATLTGNVLRNILKK